MLPLRPAEADAAAELVRELTADLVEDMTDKPMAQRAARGRGKPEPHGVLVEQGGAAPLPVAILLDSVFLHLFPQIVGQLWRRRAAGVGLCNMEGHRLTLITAQTSVRDAGAAATRLATHPDFRTEEEDELTWWGRELSTAERETALASLRSELGDEAARETQEAEERPRWLRGRLRPGGPGFEIEVNSEERLSTLLDLLDELGFEPEVSRRSVIGPAQDMPPIPAGTLLGFGATHEAVDAWREHWPDERVPALGKLTPRAAARRPKERPHLEAMLREFEHDADELSRQGRPAPDVAGLRATLGMERWWE